MGLFDRLKPRPDVRDRTSEADPPDRDWHGSAHYWEERYKHGGNSGLGSYGKLAEFKATFLNDFVREQKVETVIEFGCGDGNQLALAEYPSYIGLDVSSHAIERCIHAFATDESKSFFVYSSLHFVDRRRLFHADLALSLDVLYHLTEDSVFEAYLAQLFGSGDRFVIVYSSNHDVPTRARHVKHRKFTDHVPRDQWTLANVVKSPFESVPESPSQEASADFYVFQKA